MAQSWINFGCETSKEKMIQGVHKIMVRFQEKYFEKRETFLRNYYFTFGDTAS
jgi:hypothetical protein